MKIGELSKRTGVSIRSLRYYEEQHLLVPSREDNGYREYSPLAVEQVRTIQFYLSLGLSTAQIASFLHCVIKNEEAFCEEVLPVYREKLEEINEQIRLLQRIQSNLEERIQYIVRERQANQEGEKTHDRT
ncbi:Mercuric resistance operon regulatory protein [Paenibacillus solanacearum]|uniref:Mercuric resistance operon regulatory protein n=1 Tax=Paenibacillus solanacearum TaxID=2048548 RepID=A0A916NPY6_9BACL|nr:MerR family transcriptional regulator [Paenibacillus solanacearum]CAG7618661.1 Mercuric resistance operon regulatory protein [Paenibacillus solanacearum]